LGALSVGALFLLGCGGERSAEGSATLWVTRDHGEKVMLVRTVPAGVTALQALREEADVETRYGGRFVQSIEGIEGSTSARRDWFYFVNGFEVDRGAAEYRLHPGDIEWWDFRSWRERMREPVVVGAFPEPFVHGFDGTTRPAAVRYRTPALARLGRSLGRLVKARSVAAATAPVSDGANVLLLVPGGSSMWAETRTPGSPAGSPVRFVVSAGAARRLLQDIGAFRFRYRVPA